MRDGARVCATHVGRAELGRGLKQDWSAHDLPVLCGLCLANFLSSSVQGTPSGLVPFGRVSEVEAQSALLRA